MASQTWGSDDRYCELPALWCSVASLNLRCRLAAAHLFHAQCICRCVSDVIFQLKDLRLILELHVSWTVLFKIFGLAWGLRVGDMAKALFCYTLNWFVYFHFLIHLCIWHLFYATLYLLSSTIFCGLIIWLCCSSLRGINGIYKACSK